VSSGDLEGVQRLLDNGVDPNVELSSGLSPFQTALVANRPAIARLLVKRGADPHFGTAPDSGMYAHGIDRHFLETIGVMLEVGLDPNGLSGQGVSPLVVAKMRNLDDIVALMAAHGAECRWDGLDDPHLFAAILEGTGDEVVAALAEGENPNGKGPFGMTPLEMAVQRHRRDIVDLLLGSGADPNTPGSEGRTPLHVAAFQGDVDVACDLLDHGAFVDADDGRAGTPLAYAREAGQKEMADLLEQRGGHEVVLPPDLGIVGFDTEPQGD
jgi:cytohesin